MLNMQDAINKQIARAIGLGLNGEINSAIQTLEKCGNRLIRLRRNEERIRYLFGASCLLLPILLVLLCLRVSVDFYPNLVEVPHSWLILTEIITCGSLGGIFSVALGLRDLDVNIDAGPKFNMLAGASRILIALIALIAGIIVYFGVKTNVVLGTLGKENGNYGLYLAAMIAGFSESFIPNIVERITRNENDNLDSNLEKRIGDGS